MEMKKILESLQECGAMPTGAPMQQGTPVSMNVSLNASGKEHVEDLINMMKNAGMGGAKEFSPDMMPMRMDMERLRDIVDGPKALPAPEGMEAEESYANEPDEKYDDHETMIHDLSGGINREKKMYAKAQDGDNAMAIEDIKAALYAALKEKSTGDYSAKKARAGKDIGKPGKEFAKIAKSAGEKYGSKERGEKVAGAVLAKLRKG